jgi:hypothetical protein
MRDIAHGFFEASPAMLGPIVALVLFFLVFVAIAVRVMRSRASDYQGAASLPLEGDDR